MSRSLREQLAPLLNPGAVSRCVRKYRYLSEREAQGAANGRLKSAVDRPPALSVYRCIQCGGWHLSKLQQNTTP